MASNDFKTTLEEMRRRSSEELLNIWTSNDRETWRGEAFDAIAIVLGERGEPPPPQKSQIRRSAGPKDKMFRRIHRPTRFERAMPPGQVAALWSLTSWTLIILGVLFFFVALGYTTQIPGVAGYVGTCVVLAISSLLGVAVALLRARAESFRALRANASTVRHLDPRPPVVFLRSFVDDFLTPEAKPGFMQRFGLGFPQSFDELLADELSEYGPVITVGLPGEELPPPGAARGLLSPEHWQEEVESIGDTAALIVVLVGETEGLLWEVNMLVRRQILPKVLFVLPPTRIPGRAADENQQARNIAPPRWSTVWSLADDSTWQKLLAMRQRGLEPMLLHCTRPGRGWIVLSQSQDATAYRNMIQDLVPRILADPSGVESRTIANVSGLTVVEIDTASAKEVGPLAPAPRTATVVDSVPSPAFVPEPGASRPQFRMPRWAVFAVLIVAGLGICFAVWFLLPAFKFKEGKALYDFKSFEEARPPLRQACDGGNMEGCYYLGELYENGQGGAQDFALARTVFQKACDGGNMESCDNLGKLYENGQGGAQDYALARWVYQKACDGGNVEICDNLGKLYENGQGGAQDYALARTVFQKACDGGNMESCDNLGKLYENGQGGAQDYALAYTVYVKACDGGNMESCDNLGKLYENGQGGAQDFAQARWVYQDACYGGEMTGCYDLGVLYANGQGGARDYAQARALYKKACDGGIKPACTDLRKLH